MFEDVVISVGGSAGLILPFNNSYVRLNNLFFIGGDTLRGFAVGGVGPRDANTTDAIGGQYYYTATTELSYPLPFVPKEVASSARPSWTSVRCGASRRRAMAWRRC